RPPARETDRSPQHPAKERTNETFPRASTLSPRRPHPGAFPPAGGAVMTALQQLRTAMCGPGFSSEDEGYQSAREIWNRAIPNQPAIIACCVSVADVQAAVAVAAHHGLPLSVKAGGHDWAGRSLRHGGVVVDLSRMRSVTVDPLTRAATIEGGATIGDLARACRPHGLVPVTGTVRTVGMAGLTLAGGYGPLAGRCGLVLDNLLAAEVILADGRRVIADALTNPDLFWALRGGGGNFGVVTRLRYRLHPFEQVV